MVKGAEIGVGASMAAMLGAHLPGRDFASRDCGSDFETDREMSMALIVDEAGDGEAVVRSARGLGKSFVVVQARLGLVGTECEPLDLYLCGGRHIGRVELTEFLDVTDDGRKLGRHSSDFFGRKIESREPGDLPHPLFGQPLLATCFTGRHGRRI
jgi:hypothetical protein